MLSPTAIHSLNAGATVSFESVKRQGIGATKFRVTVEETKKHRHLSHIVKMIEAAEISARARRDAIAIFQRLGEAEAKTHQVPIEKVHFHEVGAADSIADIVGACVAFDLLGVDEIFCSAINVGSGTVDTEHGMLPVPAPATARLLENAPVYARGPAMELTTPTGAALAATLRNVIRRAAADARSHAPATARATAISRTGQRAARHPRRSDWRERSSGCRRDRSQYRRFQSRRCWATLSSA